MITSEEPKEIELPGKIKSLVNSVIKVAINNVETEKQIRPVAILHSAEKNEAHYVAMDFSDEESKYKSFYAAKEIAKELKADTSIFVTEAYLRRASPDESVDDIYRKNGGSLANDSKSVECLIITVETVSGRYLGQAPIRECNDTKSKRTCDRPRFYANDLQGNMVGFIERQVIQ